MQIDSGARVFYEAPADVARQRIPVRAALSNINSIMLNVSVSKGVRRMASKKNA